ncbi:MAG: hypothetical protein AAGF73_16910 [Actinomycetota bacterium]
MAPWTCPSCARTFGAQGRSHVCSPGVTLDRRLSTERLARKIASQGARHHHVFNLDDVSQLDDELLAWIIEAFDPDGEADPSFDPMVPDDVDI